MNSSSAGVASESAVFEDRVALDKLSSLVSGLIDKLNRTPAPPDASTDTRNDFSGFHALSSSKDEAGVAPASQPDPLDGLDHLTRDDDVDEDFPRALGDLSGHFHGEEEKGEPLADSLATILNASLRHQPVSESVKLTCAKIKLPSNVPNLTMPVTNAAITKAMSVNGCLVDAKLFQTNCLLTKAIVPIAVCVNDIGQKKDPQGRLVGPAVSPPFLQDVWQEVFFLFTVITPSLSGSLPVPPSFSDPAFFRPAASPGEGDARAETTPALIPLECENLAGPCYVFKNHFAPGFVFQLENGDIDKLIKSVMILIDVFLKEKVAHNMFITRGTPLLSACYSEDTYSTVRVMLWARDFMAGAKDVDLLNTAACELAGHVPVYSLKDWDTLSEKEVLPLFTSVCKDKYETVLPKVISAFQ
ncbi:uncharacterized protein LOC123498229 [Portunus trituberculatus]|uniref:uncharacterized protein LOC123498229 n=1 Tax=Portunus trituberculatus TaxID=210409 RepID=UPI001E1CCA98|nr:uncharacterized protein LOC123498229 [Portunus trituberculatus]